MVKAYIYMSKDKNSFHIVYGKLCDEAYIFHEKTVSLVLLPGQNVYIVHLSLQHLILLSVIIIFIYNVMILFSVKCQKLKIFQCEMFCFVQPTAQNSKVR